jgi:hypothetical protein
MLILIYLFFLNSVCAIPTKSDSVVSLEKDEKNLKTKTKALEVDDLQFSEKEETFFDDHALNSVLDEILGQGQFTYEKVPESHLSGVAPVNFRNIPVNTVSNVDEDEIVKTIENFVSNEDWDQFLHLSETDRETHSAVPPKSQHVQWTHLQPAPNNRKNQNTKDLRTPMSIDDEMMKSVLDKYKYRGQFEYDWKTWDEKVHSAHPSGVATSKLNNHPRRTVSKDWDHFLQIMEADPEALTVAHPNSQHVLEGRTIVRPVPINRLNAGKVGKLMSEDSSISVSKAISSSAENILSKLPRKLPRHL